LAAAQEILNLPFEKLQIIVQFGNTVSNSFFNNFD